jgi:uncharacterized protein (DUF1800 family)
MRPIRGLFLLVLSGCATARVAGTGAGAGSTMAGTGPGALRYEYPELDAASAAHLLNRLTFGPRPGDVERVGRLGVAAWLEQQLEPERLEDPAALRVREAYTLAFLPAAELFRRYPPPNLQRQAGARRRREAAGEPMDPRRDSMMQAQLGRGYREMGGQVVMATLARHATSERQLLEVMTDFWFNHFNVFIGKNNARYVTADYVERAIRPNALGRFADLLTATARHPAMLIYLDNFQSVAPDAQPPFPARRAIGRMPPEARANLPRGLNENYARELLELHTLGVDGGYTQQDVQQVARILSGWSIGGPGRGDFAFEFRPWAHDMGEKTVLGVRFPAGRGMDEGLRLLEMLAAHPSTARHISHKLCARFVSDEASDGCVDAATSAFTRSGGDIAVVVRAIVATPDFWAPQVRRAKVKSPLEFVVSALRATSASLDSTPRAAQVLQQLGQPLFMQPVPTGYPERSEDWVNSGALLARMNVAMGMAAGRLPGITTNLDVVVPATGDYDRLVADVNRAVLAGQASANTLRVIREQIADQPEPRMARALAVGLALGSPDFQRQ